MSCSDEDENLLKRRKKEVVNSERYKRNVIKKAKVSGKEDINMVGKTIPDKKPASNVCSCKESCFKIYTADDMVEIFTKLHDMETKTQQGIYLQSLMKISPVICQRSRPGSASAKPKSSVVTILCTILCTMGFVL
nr:uncharacterized protein LOC124808091 [Hydra vulgaris]